MMATPSRERPQPAPHSGGGAAPDPNRVTVALLHRRQLGLDSGLSAQQRRVLATDGPPYLTYLGTDAKGRPVVEALVGIPNTLRTWAVLRNGDPTDVTQPVVLVHREPEPGPEQCAQPVAHLPVLPAPTPPNPELVTRRNLAALRAVYPTVDYIEGDEARYVLVERSASTGWWLTYCASPEAAADAYDNQEHPEHWQAKLLVDLETGQRWTAHTEITYRTTWENTP